MKKGIIFLCLMLCSMTLFSNDLTKVGVVDVSKIYNRFIQESAAKRKLDEYQSNVDEQVSQRKIEIDQIEQELVSARDDDDEALVVELEAQLNIKRINLQEFAKHKTREYNAMISSETSKHDFSTKLMEAIKRVASQNGFSVIFHKDTSGLLWNSPDVDVTDLVIQSMME